MNDTDTNLIAEAVARMADAPVATEGLTERETEALAWCEASKIPSVVIVCDALRSMVEQVDRCQTERDDAAETFHRQLLEYAKQAPASQPTVGGEAVKCNGMNCGSADYRFHSAECFAEYDAAVAAAVAADQGAVK